ncbi:hypothetical protein F4779DRAFT_60225 [Xylariaceae sp. FL0662B]|nr:hypothetical protein F4779DRAFT_60225 [Xylariaceae sp. FL0662B]
MAAPDVTMADIQRRVADNPDARYKAFDSYPWTKDRIFTAQLSSALGGIHSDESTLSGTALQARIQRFEQQTKIKIDADAYKQWLVDTNQHQPSIVSEQTIAVEVITKPNPEDRKLARLLVELGDPLGQLALQQVVPEPSDTSIPSWQSAAPTTELYVQRDTSSADPDKEPYPKKFEEIVEFVVAGKPIPGIRKIPDTVVEDPSITAHGRLAVPPKPWETRRAGSGEDPTPISNGTNT